MTWKNPQANYPCECRTPEDLADQDDVPVAFDEELNEFHLGYEGRDGKGHYLIYYCPFCGGKLPGSLRDRQFSKVSDEEYQRLKLLTKDIDTMNSAIDILGEPDNDSRGLTYTNLSETACVYITLKHGDKINVRIDRKYIGKK